MAQVITDNGGLSIEEEIAIVKKERDRYEAYVKEGLPIPKDLLKFQPPAGVVSVPIALG